MAMAAAMANQRAARQLCPRLWRGISTTSTASVSSRCLLATRQDWNSRLSSPWAPQGQMRLRCQSVLRGSQQWYSTNNDNEVPNSRIWNFDEIKKLVEAKDRETVIIDVREPGEILQTGRIPGAVNIPITTAVQSFHVCDKDFEDMYGFARPPKEANLVFYCRAGVRARAAAGLAQHAGWTRVGEYPGSWLDWETHQGPVEKV